MPTSEPAGNLIMKWLNDPSDCVIPPPCIACRPPIAISNRYGAIDSDNDAMVVPIGGFIKASRKKLKKTKVDRGGDSVGPSGHAASGPGPNVK